MLGSGDQILYCEDDNRFDVENKDIRTMPLSFTRKEILNKKSHYLPGDKLSLHCECIFSTGELHQIENVNIDIPQAVGTRTNNPDLSRNDSNVMKKSSTFPSVAEQINYLTENVKNDMTLAVSTRTNNPDLSMNESNAVRKSPTYPSLIEDIKNIYQDQCLTDVELKTESKSFLAHKMVLCARSPVFRRMLTTDMREKNSAYIRVDDLEDDVLHRFLLFLYSDAVQKLEWTLATRLYYAADKYQVGGTEGALLLFPDGAPIPTHHGGAPSPGRHPRGRRAEGGGGRIHPEAREGSIRIERMEAPDGNASPDSDEGNVAEVREGKRK